MSEEKKFVPAVRTLDFYIGLLVTWMILLGIKNWWPETIPFSLDRFFFIRFDPALLSTIPWFLMLVGPVLTLIVAFLTRNGRSESIQILQETPGNVVTSILAGVFEEVSFRWLAFYYTIFIFGVIHSYAMSLSESETWNWITGNLWFSIPLIILALAAINFIGLVGYVLVTSKSTGCIATIIGAIIGLAAVLIDLYAFFVITWSWTNWIYSLLVPAVDTLTNGALHGPLTDYGWAVGAAMVSVNWRFSSGHNYQGWVGIANSWVIGMIMFWIVWNFGLPVAMITHALYDLSINFIRAGDAMVELGAEVAIATSKPNAIARLPRGYRR